MLRAAGIGHGFGGEQVFEDLSLEIEPGEVTTVIGPSGAGKSTLLRLFALFETPDSGSIRHDDTDVWTLSERDRLAIRRRIGMVFQEASLFNISAARNAEYGLRVRMDWRDRIERAVTNLLGRSETPTKVEEALETVGLGEKKEQNAGSLSGGEAQRVAFARALAIDPDLLLFDEPTSDLDPRNTAAIEKAISDARDRGISVLMASHDMNQAQRISDRVGVLIDGSLIEVGSPERIFDSPKDERTRRFVNGELIYDEPLSA